MKTVTPSSHTHAQLGLGALVALRLLLQLPLQVPAAPPRLLQLALQPHDPLLHLPHLPSGGPGVGPTLPEVHGSAPLYPTRCIKVLPRGTGVGPAVFDPLNLIRGPRQAPPPLSAAYGGSSVAQGTTGLGPVVPPPLSAANVRPPPAISRRPPAISRRPPYLPPPAG